MSIKELRERAGLTQEQLAIKIEVDQSAVSNWERGKYKPVRKYQNKLAAVLGCTVDALLSSKQGDEHTA